VKTASEVIRRHEQQLHATLHKSVQVDTAAGRFLVTLDIVPDEMEPHALLAAANGLGESVAQVKVGAGFKLNATSAARWVDEGFAKPA
jgi:hypothetical protein